MKAMNYISQEISKGKNLEFNLSKYATGMSSMYNTLGYIKLSMNYYTAYDCQREELCKESLYIRHIAEFHGLIGELLDNNLKSVEPVEKLRNELTEVMEVVTAYVDRLRIFEYVLNRVEYRFLDKKFDETYYNTYLTNDLMHYILSDKDNVVIHSKISEVVEQLPMRLSRNKFYDYLRDAFSLYHGAQKGTIDDFVYSLKTTAMLNSPVGFEDMFPKTRELLLVLESADYANLDKAEFDNLSGALRLAVEQMTACADAFVLLAQLVNDLYTVVLTSDVAIVDAEDIGNAMSILKAVYEAYKEGCIMVDDSVLERFVAFEGKQEHILMTVSESDFAIEYAFENYKEELESTNLTSVYKGLMAVTKLQSGSNFVSLIKDEEKFEIPQDSYADETCEKLIEEFDKAFKTLAQPLKRAVMSAVLAQLPVFFNNSEEIQSYINVSLMQCSDVAEKSAVVEVLKMIMSDDN